ncbi:MAG: glycosyltransferase family 4 protein [Planctomycetia bacterium]|nr:glycosyltransferase family 4 protein [Planctomycetia bacterium]
MNICMTHYAFYPTTGGVESHLLDLCIELVRQGHRVFALVGSLEDAPEYEVLEGVEVFRRELMNPEVMRQWKIDAGIEPETVSPGLLAATRRMYEEFINEHDIDIVHAHNFHHFLPEYGLALTELVEETGLATTLTIHEVWSEFICEDLLARTKWGAIICVSDHVRRETQLQAPHLTDMDMVYHGIDCGMFDPAADTGDWGRELGISGHPTVIHPARMLPWKGVIYSVKALGKLRKRFPDIRLIITDTDKIVDWIDELRGYRDDVHKFIADRGLTENVICRSFSYFELPGVYNHCDVVIYPTIGEEPFGLVPIEGMACEKPVVVSASGGLVESVVDGETGYIVKKADSDALADRIGKLLEDKELATRMGKAGRQRVLKLFTRQRMTRQVVSLYRKAIAKRQELREQAIMPFMTDTASDADAFTASP